MSNPFEDNYYTGVDASTGAPLAAAVEEEEGAGGGPGAYTTPVPARTRSSLVAELELSNLSDEDEEEEEEDVSSSHSSSDLNLYGAGGRGGKLELCRWTTDDDVEVQELFEELTMDRAGTLLLEEPASALMLQETGGGGGGSARETSGPPADDLFELLGDQNTRRSNTRKTIIGTRKSTFIGMGMGSRSGRSSQMSEDMDPCSSKFDSRKYLGTVYKETSLESLKKGASNLQARINDQKESRMMLVKENFDRFIKCKNTIDDIHSRLQMNELDTSSEAASTVLLLQSLKDVKDKSGSIFEPLLERQQERERLQFLLTTFRRYQWFLEMPSTLEEHLNNRKNDKVVSCYKKSKIFMEENPNVKLFSKVFQEIEHVITGYKDKLYRNLDSCKVDVESAKELITTLVRLEGNQILAQNSQKQNPFVVYLESVSKYIVRKMTESFSKFEAQLADLENGQQIKEDALLDSILLNIPAFVKESTRQRSETGPLKLFLEYENLESPDLSLKLKVGALQSSYASLVSSSLLTALDILSDIYLQEKSMFKEMLRGRKDVVDRTNQTFEIVDQAEAKLNLILEEYKGQMQKLISLSEKSHGLWLSMSEIILSPTTVLEEIVRRNSNAALLDVQYQIHDLNIDLTGRLVGCVCGQMEKICTFVALDAAKTTQVIKAKQRVYEEKPASLSMLYIGDALLVGLRQIVDTLDSIDEEQKKTRRYNNLAAFVTESLSVCFRVCANKFEKVGRDIMDTSRERSGDYKRDIKRVLQVLKDAYFLQNQVVPSLETIHSVRIDNSIAISNQNNKKAYVDLNIAKIRQLQRDYMNGSTQEDFAKNNLHKVRSHVFMVLHFFVEHHAIMAGTDCQSELLEGLGHKFLEGLSEEFNKYTRTEPLSNSLARQALLEITFLEKALGTHINPPSRRHLDRIKKFCNSSNNNKIDEQQLSDALESTKLHWLCFH